MGKRRPSVPSRFLFEMKTDWVKDAEASLPSITESLARNVAVEDWMSR